MKLVGAPWWLAPQLRSLRRLGQMRMTLVTFRISILVLVVGLLGRVWFRVVTILVVGSEATKVSLCSILLVL